jgi:hypothetical protein
MLENMHGYLLKHPVQVGAVLLLAFLTVLEIIRGGDPLEILIRMIFLS